MIPQEPQPSDYIQDEPSTEGDPQQVAELGIPETQTYPSTAPTPTNVEYEPAQEQATTDPLAELSPEQRRRVAELTVVARWDVYWSFLMAQGTIPFQPEYLRWSANHHQRHWSDEDKALIPYITGKVRRNPPGVGKGHQAAAGFSDERRESERRVRTSQHMGYLEDIEPGETMPPRLEYSNEQILESFRLFVFNDDRYQDKDRGQGIPFDTDTHASLYWHYFVCGRPGPTEPYHELLQRWAALLANPQTEEEKVLVGRIQEGITGLRTKWNAHHLDLDFDQRPDDYDARFPTRAHRDQ